MKKEFELLFSTMTHLELNLFFLSTIMSMVGVFVINYETRINRYIQDANIFLQIILFMLIGTTIGLSLCLIYSLINN